MFLKNKNCIHYGPETFGSRTCAQTEQHCTGQQLAAREGPWFRSSDWGSPALSRGTWSSCHPEPSAAGWGVLSPQPALCWPSVSRAGRGAGEQWAEGGWGQCQCGAGNLSLPGSHFNITVSLADALVSTSVLLRWCWTALSERQGKKQRNCSHPSTFFTSHPEAT